MKKNLNILTLVFTIAVATAFMFSTATRGQEMQKSECENACTKTYQDCRTAPNSDQAACKKALDECLASCKATPSPSPAPSVSPSPEVTPSPSPSASPTPPAGS